MMTGRLLLVRPMSPRHDGHTSQHLIQVVGASKFITGARSGFPNVRCAGEAIVRASQDGSSLS